MLPLRLIFPLLLLPPPSSSLQIKAGPLFHVLISNNWKGWLLYCRFFCMCLSEQHSTSVILESLTFPIMDGNYCLENCFPPFPLRSRLAGDTFCPLLGELRGGGLCAHATCLPLGEFVHSSCFLFSGAPLTKEAACGGFLPWSCSLAGTLPCACLHCASDRLWQQCSGLLSDDIFLSLVH